MEIVGQAGIGMRALLRHILQLLQCTQGRSAKLAVESAGENIHSSITPATCEGLLGEV